MNPKIVNRIWDRAPTGDAYMPTQWRGPDGRAQWDERNPFPSDVMVVMGMDQPALYDYYFSPLTFEGDRKNENVLEPIRVLYADLDEADPREIWPRPTIAWETSPGMYQAVWFVTDDMTRPFFEQLNKRLTYAVGADKGGWHPSKVLRVPDSINWKRGGVQGRLLWDTGPYVSARILDQKLPELFDLESKAEGRLMPQLPSRELGEALYKRLPPSLKYLWNDAPRQSRSEHIWRVILEMKEWGFSPEDVFQTLWYMPSNKYRKERRPARLWQDIERAY